MKFVDQVVKRSERAILTMISKKFLSWYVVLAYFHFGKINAESFLYYTTAIFVIDVAQKKIGLDPTQGVPK